MSNLPPLNTVVGDPIISTDLSAFSPSASRSRFDFENARFGRDSSADGGDIIEQPIVSAAAPGEDTPLLGGAPPSLQPRKKPFYRARPLWLVPFAITASLVRGMTLAPRVEVYTQLACNSYYPLPRYNHTSSLQLPESAFDFPSARALHNKNNTEIILPPLPSPSEQEDDGGEEDPRRLPRPQCLTDPLVQAGAARLQTMMTTVMGLLSALTAGWWGHFGERHGRTRVLSICTLGLVMTDSIFILVSTPNSFLSGHGHKFLLVAPFVEGLLGGWSALQSATTTYISDCTSSGSRARIFATFVGVFYIGLSLGPAIGGWLIRHASPDGVLTVAPVFYVAITCSVVNFIFAALICPESLSKETRARAMKEYEGKGKGKARARIEDGNGNEEVTDDDVGLQKTGIVREFVRPLAVFLPVTVGEGSRRRKDWSLTILAAVLFGWTLSTGVAQMKYMYAVHTYEWNVEQLGYYISFIGGARAISLLLLLPAIISTFKPKPKPTPETVTIAPGDKKPKPTKAQLAREISFDLGLTRCSLFIDILSNALVALVPVPSYSVHSIISTMPTSQQQEQAIKHSQALFVMASSLSSLGSGTLPAIQSLALCITQLRGLEKASMESGNAGGQVPHPNGAEGAGTLFGALSVIQAVAGMIIGPMLFGLIYSGTVGSFPKAVFVVAAGILICSLLLLMFLHGPPTKQDKKRSGGRDAERGRSRVSKDLRGGAVGY